GLVGDRGGTVSESPLPAALSLEAVRDHVERITGGIPSRLAGSENARRMAEDSCQALLDVGVDARVEACAGLVSFPQEAECRVLEPVELAIGANTLGHSLGTADDGLSGELVSVGAGAFEDYAGRDLAGKIILTELSYSPARQEKQRIAA